MSTDGAEATMAADVQMFIAEVRQVSEELHTITMQTSRHKMVTDHHLRVSNYLAAQAEQLGEQKCAMEMMVMMRQRLQMDQELDYKVEVLKRHDRLLEARMSTLVRMKSEYVQPNLQHELEFAISLMRMHHDYIVEEASNMGPKLASIAENGTLIRRAFLSNRD